MIQKLVNTSVQVHSKITLNGAVIIILTLLKNYYVSIETLSEKLLWKRSNTSEKLLWKCSKTLLKNYYGSVQKHF